MSAVVWSIERAGTKKPLAAWGITGAQLTLRNLDTDELTFRVPRADLFADPIFAYGDTLILWEGDTRRFQGKVTRLPAIGSRRQESDRYVVSGPWEQLSRLVYQQPRMIANDTFSGFNSEDTTRVVLGQADDGSRIDTGAQIAAIIAYGVTAGVTLIAGTVPAFVRAPLDECRDITCAEAIRRQMAFTPDAVSWFDYSEAVAFLNCQQRALLTVDEIDLADKDKVEEFALTPRNDLVPPGVVFIYINSVVHDDATFAVVTRDTVGAVAGVGVVTATIDLMGAGTDHQEAPPIGLAALYWASLNVLPWEGSVKLHGLDCDFAFRPGKVLNLLGGRAAWETMIAVIQTVTHELDRGVTTIDFGPPQHLSPQNFVSQILFNRRAARPPDTTTFPIVQPPTVPPTTNGVSNGGPVVTNTNAGLDPKSYAGNITATGTSTPMAVVLVKYCDVGNEVLQPVYAPVNH